MISGFMLAAGLIAQAAPAEDPAAAAQTTQAEAGVIAYPAAFFADSRPNNAFDMIGRLPGFTFSGGEAVRGFAGAAGNVLIDGERPTSKSVTLDALLKRLPASSVVRIDLVRGSAPGIDMQGQALVANVIRSQAASQNLSATLGSRIYAQDGWMGPQADVEWSRRAGDLSLEAAAHYGWNASPNGGDGALTKYFPNGAVKETGPYLQRRRTGLSSANGSAELALGEDLVRVNLGVSRNDARPAERVGRNSPTGPSRGEVFTATRTIEDVLEAGADYTHPFTENLAMQVLALQTLGRVRGKTSSTQVGLLQTSANREQSGESIVRSVLTWNPKPSLSIEGGGEGAFNFLEGHTSVTLNGAPTALSNGDLRVEERRAEAFVTTVWKPIAKLSVTGETRAEVSKISSTGDTDRSRSFVFLKPRVVVAYAPTASSQVRLRLQREIGQLTFRDFVASADLTTGTFDAGNADLEPERAWVIEGAVERRFWGKGVVSATVIHQDIKKVVDLLPVGAADAPGNIGDGRRDKLILTATVPLTRLGIANGLITSSTTWTRSEVTDPVTGAKRRISNDLPLLGKISFTQDLTALSSTWGADFNLAQVQTSYRINEIRRQAEQASVSLFWNWKPDPSLTVRGEFRNLASRRRDRLRTRFIGPRSAGVLNETELESHRFSPFAYLTVRKSF